jgi:hypothetical protein
MPRTPSLSFLFKLSKRIIIGTSDINCRLVAAWQYSSSGGTKVALNQETAIYFCVVKGIINQEHDFLYIRESHQPPRELRFMNNVVYNPKTLLVCYFFQSLWPSWG